MNKIVEIKKGDKIIFKAGNGKGSVVFTKNKGNYFMPAKFGMRIDGIKSPIGKYESFIINNFTTQKFENKYIVKCTLTRCKDYVQFQISEDQLFRNFAKPDSTFWSY